MINFEMATEITAAVAFLSFLVNIIVQVVKETSVLKPVPTKLVVLVTSFIVNICAYISYVSYTNDTIQLYVIFSVILSSFVVSYISMYGFESLKDLYDKSQVKK